MMLLTPVVVKDIASWVSAFKNKDPQIEKRASKAKHCTQLGAVTGKAQESGPNLVPNILRNND